MIVYLEPLILDGLLVDSDPNVTICQLFWYGKVTVKDSV